MTDVDTAPLLAIKPSSDDDSGFRHGFEATNLVRPSSNSRYYQTLLD